MSDIRVTFQPSGRAVHVQSGATIREAASLAGIPIDFPCGGQGSCGKCRVRLSPAPKTTTSSESRLISPEDLANGYRLACQCHVSGQSIIEVPEHSLLGRSYQILESAGPERERDGVMPLRLVQFALPEPTLEDDIADFSRLQRELGPLQADVSVMRTIGKRLRDQEFRGTAVIAGNRLLDIVPADASTAAIAAFDIGTTTVVATLHDAATGTQLARASAINPQTSFGDDVLARITRACDNDSGLLQLHNAIIGAINDMLAAMAGDAGIETANIYEISFAGNTTMQHLLLGLHPAALGLVPFSPTIADAVQISARDAGINAHPKAQIYVFPVIGGFVGGDTVAGMIATEMDKLPGSTLLVDIGTNGELVVFHDGELLATSCAAGPAFEGAKIQHGMRAAPGAIEEITLKDDVELRVIGDKPPVGLCGSALIDIVAELLRNDLLLATGSIPTGDDIPNNTPDALRERIRPTDDGGEFVIAWDYETATGRPIVLTQRDIRELQLGTGAIRSGIQTILHRVELPFDQLDRLLVAGAFGNYIRCENAQRMGLLPSEMPVDRIQFVGNTSLSGAQGAALSQTMRDRAAELARKSEHIDLSRDPHFYELFVDALIFPEG